MRTAVGTIFLIASGLFMAWTSWISFTAPGTFGQRLGFTIAGVDGRNEIRAQYGGFFLAAALVSLLALTAVIPRQSGLITNATVYGGLIAGRLVSLCVDGGASRYGPVIRLLFFIDAAGFALSIVALAFERFSNGSR